VFLFLPSAALSKGLIRRVPDEMLSAKICALGKGAVFGSDCVHVCYFLPHIYIPDAIITPLNAPMDANIFSFEAPSSATVSSNNFFACKEH
jgi:hypothetical protein